MSYSYPHPTPWNGKDLKGTYHVTIKIDGVRMLRDESGNPVSRNGKPLYNLEEVPQSITDAEIYYGSWENSITHVRSSTSDVGNVDMEHVFSLFPNVDDRLDLGYIANPTVDEINKMLQCVLEDGHEGLVLRGYEESNKNKLFKVKPHETYDVKVTDAIEGTGKHKGRLGALITPMGKVGTGFTDKQRAEYWNKIINNPDDVIGVTIEVECWELTKAGKFRHPRFIRERVDK